MGVEHSKHLQQSSQQGVSEPCGPFDRRPNVFPARFVPFASALEYPSPLQTTVNRYGLRRVVPVDDDDMHDGSDERDKENRIPYSLRPRGRKLKYPDEQDLDRRVPVASPIANALSAAPCLDAPVDDATAVEPLPRKNECVQTESVYVQSPGEYPFSIELSNRLPMPVRIIVSWWNSATQSSQSKEFMVLPREHAANEHSSLRKERCRLVNCFPSAAAGSHGNCDGDCDGDGTKAPQPAGIQLVQENRRMTFPIEAKVTNICIVFGWHCLTLLKEDLLILPARYVDLPPLQSPDCVAETLNDYYLRVRWSENATESSSATDSCLQCPFELALYRANCKSSVFISEPHNGNMD
eukprot:ANDGO_03028.mRNA.1 hypothetical protein